MPARDSDEQTALTDTSASCQQAGKPDGWGRVSVATARQGEPHLGRYFATSEVDEGAAFGIDKMLIVCRLQSSPRIAGHGDRSTMSQSCHHATDRYQVRSTTSNTTSIALCRWSSISGQLRACGQSHRDAACSPSFWGQNTCSSPLRALENAAGGGLPKDVWTLT